MRDAETVTFGGSALDRAADLRSALEDRPLPKDARVLPFWRGKPLLEDAGDDLRAAMVPPGHACLREGSTPILLGRDDHGPILASDLTGWTPADIPETLGAFADPSVQRHPELPDHQGFGELRAAMLRLPARDAELAATARGLLEWHRTHGYCARCGAGTRIVQAGWQRRCDACGAHHFPRTDPVVIMLVTHGNDVLLGRSPGWPDRMYSLLAGFIEPGETMEAAVRREVFEEAGVRVGRVGYLASQPWPFPASLMLGCRATATSRDITVDPVEIEDAVWLSREETMRAMSGDHPDIAPARPGAIAHFLLHRWLSDRLD